MLCKRRLPLNKSLLLIGASLDVWASAQQYNILQFYEKPPLWSVGHAPRNEAPREILKSRQRSTMYM